MSAQTFVIVGGGLAAAKAAETLRSQGFDGRVVLIGDERQFPYERPPLSKDYLAGKSTLADARVHGHEYYVTHGIEVVDETVTAIARTEQTVTLAGGEILRYDRLLIATGATPRRAPFDGAELPGVHSLRTIRDADALRAVLAPHVRLVVIGAGWIGCEVTATARGLGAEVTLLEHASAPLERVLGPELGGFFADLHRAHGVDLRTGVAVDRIEGDARASCVVLSDGSTIDADVVLVAVGAAPATAIGEATGLEVADGIVVDAQLRTSDSQIFAAGDVAAAFHPRYGRHVRVEHWANAAEQGALAARNMLGAAEEHVALPYFFSDQYDIGLEYIGLHGADDQLEIRGDTGERRFNAVWSGPDGRVTAAMHVNDWDAIEELRRLVDEGARALTG
jgi:3-phenylpropionate/trans-cinnamate dioxygenase ferredoxin reductase subunit